jgi:hypothetical protein
MHSNDTRKIYVIKEVLNLENEIVLTELEDILKGRRPNSKEKKADNIKPSDYAGCISQETAKNLLEQIEQSRKEWERNI